jgi:Cu(I)/Ag(I) efflux system protein CusF
MTGRSSQRSEKETPMRTILVPAIVLAVSLAGAPAFAQSGHGSMNHGTMKGGHAAMEGVHAAATINSIAGDTVNVTHGPIAEIGWPAMTMDLPLLEGAKVGAVTAGDEAMMMLEKGPDGLYGIRALMPAE